MKQHTRSGFTLIELVIAMAVMAMLAGAIVPAVGATMRSAARRSTLTELDLLGDAVIDFYRDTRQFPSDPLDLENAATAGWAGPYLRGTLEDPWSGQSGYAIDGFGNAYTFSASGLALTMTSDGPDRANGTTDDIALTVNVTPLLRDLTLDELAVLNTAVERYNATYLGTDPLSGTWSAALSRLVATGYLPAGSGYATDEWGDAYTGDPPGATPLTAVLSPNVTGN